MASDSCAPWLFADPYAYQYSDIATRERSLGNNKIESRESIQELPVTVSAAGSARFELDVPNAIQFISQPQETTSRFELEVAPSATIVVTGVTTAPTTAPTTVPAFAAELEGWTVHAAP
jgi:hypothetical protein